jgi:hypothetical protein
MPKYWDADMMGCENAAGNYRSLPIEIVVFSFHQGQFEYENRLSY